MSAPGVDRSQNSLTCTLRSKFALKSCL